MVTRLTRVLGTQLRAFNQAVPMVAPIPSTRAFTNTATASLIEGFHFWRFRSMGKSPAFQFYPADFLADRNTLVMTTEEVGAYCLLMFTCWLESGLPGDIEDLAATARMPVDRFEECWNKRIKRCFASGNSLLNDSVQFQHERLLEEKEKQRQWKLKCAKGGKASARKPKTRRDIDGEQSSTRLVPSKGALNGNSSSSSSIEERREESARAEPFEPNLTDIERALCEVCLIEPGMMGGMQPMELMSTAKALESSGRTAEEVRLFGRKWPKVFPSFSAPRLSQVGNEWLRVMGKKDEPDEGFFVPSPDTMVEDINGEWIRYDEACRRRAIRRAEYTGQ